MPCLFFHSWQYRIYDWNNEVEMGTTERRTCSDCFRIEERDETTDKSKMRLCSTWTDWRVVEEGQ